MSNINKITMELNGYRVVYMPEHAKAMSNKKWTGFVYEHIVIAEKSLGRQLTNTEVVHHLNGDKLNNRKENLLVLERSQHAKLHMWLSAGAPISERCRENGENSLKTTFRQPHYCKCCGLTLQCKQKNYCSVSCYNLMSRKVERPTRQQLINDLDTVKVLASIGKKYGVSCNAIRKWMKSYSLNMSTMSRALVTTKEGSETS